jgi:hypothetical protein
MLFLRLSLLEFTSRPLTLLASIKVSVFFFTLCILPPNILTYLHKPEADVYHLMSSHPGLPESFYWHIMKQSCKAVVIKHLLVSNRS